MKNKLKPIRSYIAIVALTIIIIDAYGLLLLKQSGMLSRFIFIDDLQLIAPKYEDGDLSFLFSSFPESKPLALMSSLMNKVSKIEANPGFKDVESLFKHVEKGHGLVCSGMANLFIGVLAAKNYEARRVALVRNLGDQYATHTTIEILVDRRWVIFDPTFNITFEKDGYLIGAQDIHRALLDGSFNEITPKFHGAVAYPARIDSYYMHYLSLYNNVLIEAPAQNKWYRLPPIGYWMGKKYYVQTERSLGQKNHHMRFFNSLNLFFVALLPILILFLAFLVFVISFFLRRKR
jgi:hypothetical protein